MKHIDHYTFFQKRIVRRAAWAAAVLAAALAVTAYWTAEVHDAQRQLADRLIRLHVIANSDSDADQALKLQVRDAVLARAEEILAAAPDLAAAEKALRAALPELSDLAEDVMEGEGFPYAASGTLGWERYPTRVYDTFSLPAGEYLSLRLVLGEGGGQNWWCVVFPPLCSAATSEEFSQTAEAAGMTGEEIALMTEETGGAVVRFKLVEAVESFLQSVF